jgi:DNA-binding MarR family transcriptional regulator
MERTEEQARDREQWIGHLIKSVFLSMRREAERLLQPMGLTHSQWFALGILNKKPGLTHGELEKELNIGRPSVTSLVNGMMKNGWVVRKHSIDDARVKLIFLTDEGKRLADATADLTWQVERSMRNALTDEEIRTLRHSLDKIMKRFE